MAQSPYLDQNAPEILALERQKKLADLLQSRALEQPQGQMVSGRYVAPSLLQQLAPLANAYMGRKAGKNYESQAGKLAQKLREQNLTEGKDILSTMMGQEGVAGNLPLGGTNQAIGSLEEPMGDYVAPKAAVAPDKLGALMKALGSQGSIGQTLAPQLMSNMFKEDTPLILPEGATAVNRRGEIIATGKPKEDKPPVSFQEYKLAQQEGFKGTYQEYQDMDANRKRMKIDLSGVVNPQGGYNKKGDWVTPNGAAINHTEVAKDREIVRAANDLREGLAEITPVDIKKQASLLGDVTQGGARGYIAKQLGLDALKAQVKINASAVQQTLQNLPPGPASDKDISQAKSTFPGYGDADALKDWIDNTNRMLERKIRNTNEKYGNPNWYGATTVEANPRSAPTTSDGFSIREKK
jgi:hypothetical protein